MAAQLAHPCTCLPSRPSAGYWANWDGKALEQAPLFYHDITELAAETLQGMWEELWATSEALAAALGLEEPPSPLRRIMSAMMERYGAVVGDASTLLSGFRTNGAYAGFTHAVSGHAPTSPGAAWGSAGEGTALRSRQCSAAASIVPSQLPGRWHARLI